MLLQELAVRGDSLFGTAQGSTTRVGVAPDAEERLEEVTFDPLGPIIIAGVTIAVLAVVLSLVVGSSMQGF